MFYRWWHMEEEDRGRVWRLYGWFTALMACGSCVGAVAWMAQMMDTTHVFKSKASLSKVESSSLYALALSWIPISQVTYAIGFLCLSTAKLMVLDRMATFAAPQGTGARRRWAAAGRVVMAAVVLGNAVLLAAAAAAAVHYQKAAQASNAESAAYAANNTKDRDEFHSLSQHEVQLAGSILTVQLFSEAAVLLLIVAAFVAVGVLSARRVSARLLGVDAASAAAATGWALRRRMLGTTAFVFVTFLIRCSYSTSLAVAYALRDYDKPCGSGGSCDASCHNAYTHFLRWNVLTPEFEATIVMLSSPVALLVALWGMTSKATLQVMRSSERESSMSRRLL
jgi:hypothetical protein